MDDKNIALLGFISKAADYLKDKIDDDSEEIKEVGEVDLEKIKDELSKKMGSSFSNVKNKSDDLISAGRDAFDEFISSKSMIDDFKDIFNIDFKEKNDEKDEHIINHLMEMLNEPQDEETDAYEQIITKATSDLEKEEQKNKNIEIFKDDKQDKEIDSLFSEIVAHENGDNVNEKEETLDDLFVEEPIKEETKDDALTSSEFKKILEEVLGTALDKLGGQINKEEEPTSKEEIDDIKEEIEQKVDDQEETKQLEDDINDEEELNADDILSELTNRQEEISQNNIKEEYDEILDADYKPTEEVKISENKKTYQMGKDGVLRLVETSDSETEEIPLEVVKEENNESIEKESNKQEDEEIEIDYQENVPQEAEDTVAEVEIEEEPKEFLDFLEEADLSQEQKNEIKDFLNTFDDLENIDNFDSLDDEKLSDEDEIETVETSNDFDDGKEVIDEISQEENEIENIEIVDKKEESDDNKQKDDSSENNVEYFEDYENRPLDQIYIANPGADLIKDEEESQELEDENNEAELEEEISTQEENIEPLAQEQEVQLEDNLEELDENDFVDDYINDLMSDLAKKSPTDIVEEEILKQQEAQNKIYESIKAIYPYLADSFIKGVYDLKDSLANEYEDGAKIIILHRLRFTDLEGLRRFVEVIMSHDYLVNVDENQMIVDAFKEHINTDGKILTDIFEVANQAKLLTGEYEGYRIIKDEDDSSLA